MAMILSSTVFSVSLSSSKPTKIVRDSSSFTSQNPRLQDHPFSSHTLISRKLHPVRATELKDNEKRVVVEESFQPTTSPDVEGKETEEKPQQSSSSSSVIENWVIKLEQSVNIFLTDTVIKILDGLYHDRDYARFYVLETIARVPYFAFISVLHLYESIGWWRRADYLKVHFAESWNEMHHLLIMEVQLMVTPRAEGTLKINGVRWKLSGSVVGFYNFESSLLKKTITKGRKAKNSPIDNLTFIVIKSLPKLQGVIHPLPQKVYTGDVRNLVLELKNVSDCSLKNLKMKISHPRFLSIGNLEDLNMEFPTCLEKKTSSEPSTLIYSKESQALFQFPEDTVMQGENPLVWPLWLRAAVPGNVSLYLIIYYEVGDTSSVMKYRTLRMHYNMQVLPSLDVSFRINPSPSRLEEFLVRMDIINRTISESFEVQQLSSLGAQWEISLFQSVASQFPSQSLMAGQALSYFFLLKKCRKPLSSDDKISSVRLSPQGSNKQTYNISCSPLVEFHNCERLHQETSPQDSSKTVDFILITRLNSNIKPAVSDQIRLFTHYACHCSIESTSPISWTVEGPRTINHDFSASFCEISLKMIVYNLSEVVVCVHINTYDSRSSDSQSADASAVSSGNQGGWHDLSLATDNKATLEVQGAKSEKSIPYESVSPFIWSGASSTKVQLEPMSTSEIPLQICLFSPGTYDLSNYVLNWNLLSSNDQGNQQSSGTCQGYPLYLTALPSE